MTIIKEGTIRQLIIITLKVSKYKFKTAHIFTRFPLLKLTIEEKYFFFLSPIRIRIMNFSNEHFHIFLYFGLIYSPFKPFLNSQNSCRQTSGSHFYPFSNIKNLQWKKSVFFFLLPLRIGILNHLKWIYPNIFAFWITLYSPFKPFLNSQKSCRQTSGSHFYPFSSIKNLEFLFIWDGSLYIYVTLSHFWSKLSETLPHWLLWRVWMRKSFSPPKKKSDQGFLALKTPFDQFWAFFEHRWGNRRSKRRKIFFSPLGLIWLIFVLYSMW